MKIEDEGQLLRVFIDEQDKWEGRPLFEALVQTARKEGLAGATVLRGIMGYGANSLIHALAKDARLPEDMPVVVEIVDRPEKIKRFLPVLERMVREGLVTMEKVSWVAFRGGRHAV